MFSPITSVVLCFILCSFAVSSDAFEYFHCVNPWMNGQEFGSWTLNNTEDPKNCFEQCKDKAFAFIRGQKCACANTVNPNSSVKQEFCVIGDGSTTSGGNLGASVYCNKNLSNCDLELTEDPSKQFPSISEQAVECLGVMCGTVDFSNLRHTDCFPRLLPEDCIRYCAHKKEAYAYLGSLQETTIAKEKQLDPMCGCGDSVQVIKLPPSECNMPCIGDERYMCGNGVEGNTEAGYWTIYCTTRLQTIGENETCLSFDDFKGSVGNIEHICPCSCNATDVFNRNWVVQPGTVGTMRCPFTETANSTWNCTVNGENKCEFDTRQPDFSHCHSEWLTNVTIDIKDNRDALEIIQKIEQETSNDSNYFGYEIVPIVEVLQDTLQLETEQSLEVNVSRGISFTEYGTSILSNLITNEEPWEQIRNENHASVSTKIINGSEFVGFWLSNISRSAGKSLNCEFNPSGILLGSIWWNTESDEFPGCNCNSEHKLDKNIKSPSFNSSDTYLTIKPFSDGTFRNYSAVGAIFSGNRILNSFPGEINTLGATGLQKNVNSKILSYTVAPELKERVSVTLVFRHLTAAKYPPVRKIRRKLYDGENPSAVIGSATCSFINFSPRFESGRNWTWDDAGCGVKATNRTHTVCECDHLTSFANLMDIHNYILSSPGPDQGLELATTVCCSLSVICLLITILLLGTLREIRNDRTFITQNLCFSLTISHLLILSVFDKSHYNLHEEICAAFGVVLHFTLLSSFSWMALEGLRLCQVIIDTFRRGTRMDLVYGFLGYGTPLLVVVATIGVAVSTDGIVEAYAQDETCWLRTEDYIWSFTGPATVVLLFNLVCLAFVAVASSRLAINKRRTLSQRIWSTTCMCLSLTFVFGLSWILGYFIFSGTLVFAYLFTIVNGLQGVLIFVFRCILNEPLRKAVRRNLTRTRERTRSSAMRQREPNASYPVRREATAADTRSRNTMSLGY